MSAKPNREAEHLSVEILIGDCRDRLREMEPQSVNCCVTSPPYFGLRDYGHAGQIGLEWTPEAFVTQLVEVFREVRRVLRDDGTLWLNLGDTYQNSKGQAGGVDPKQPARRHGLRPQDRPPPPGLKAKDLIGIPWMVAFALRADGWYLRQDIIWVKPNAMPESVRDRCTKAHEYIFLLSKGPRYYFDADAISEAAAGDPSSIKNRWDTKDQDVPGQKPQKRRSRVSTPMHEQYDTCGQSGLDVAGRGGRRNKRSVWTVATRPFKGAHFATYPADLITPCVLAGSPAGGVVLDPFAGAGTTAIVARHHQRSAVLIELNPEYAAMALARIEAAPVISLTSVRKPKKAARPFGGQAPLILEAA